jgi:hypothetical protein
VYKEVRPISVRSHLSLTEISPAPDIYPTTLHIDISVAAIAKCRYLPTSTLPHSQHHLRLACTSKNTISHEVSHVRALEICSSCHIGRHSSLLTVPSEENESNTCTVLKVIYVPRTGRSNGSKPHDAVQETGIEEKQGRCLADHLAEQLGQKKATPFGV